VAISGYKRARFLGFQGIVSNVSDEFLTPGFVPDMENITINKEGLAESVPNPTEVDLWANVPDWTPNTQYDNIGRMIRPTDKSSNKHFYILTTAGTTGTTEPTWPTTKGDTVTDGSAVWTTADETTDAIRTMYFGTDYGSPYLMFQIGDTVSDKTIGHTFSHYSNPISFASVSSRLFIMNLVTGLWEYQVPTWYDRSSPAQGTPPATNYMIAYQNRLWAFGNQLYNRIRYSELPGDPETDPPTPNLGPEYWDADNYFDVATEGNDIITAVFPYKQTFFIFTKNGIFAFSGAEDSNWVLTTLYRGRGGANSPYIVAADGLYYFSDDGLMRYSPSNPYPEPISDIIYPSIKDDLGNPQGLVRFGDRLYFLLNGKIWAYHLIKRTWERYIYPNANCIVAGDHLYLGTTDGKVYMLDVPGSGYLPWYIYTPHISFGDLYSQKRFLDVKTYYKTTDEPATISLIHYEDYSTSGTQLADINTYEEGKPNEMRENHQHTYSDLSHVEQYKFYGTGQVRLLGYEMGYKVRFLKGV